MTFVMAFAGGRSDANVRVCMHARVCVVCVCVCSVNTTVSFDFGVACTALRRFDFSIAVHLCAREGGAKGGVVEIAQACPRDVTLP